MQIPQNLMISCYPKDMKLLIRNLIDNAIKFNNNVLPKLKIEAKKINNEWCFQIEDNGIGMDMIYHDKVFVIFQRLNRRGQFGGTGMGLALCKKIMELHHGTIWFESELNKGTIFFFKLPNLVY